mgnify:CR=1 FL=1
MAAAAIHPLPTPQETVTLLLVSVCEDDRASLGEILRHSSWRLHYAAGWREALAFLERHPIPVVICERDLPDGCWKVLFDEASKLPQPPRLIVCSPFADNRLWAEVLNLGAYDVFITPFEPSEVFRVAFSAWQAWKNEPARGSLPAKPPASAHSLD